ncbi:MAG: hypothetical protein M3321_11655, partial [Actinomycetota bacterium]|nr:hypothetical protein [Actinomycetota bacterium]
MEGYEVMTSDDSTAGRVVDVRGDNLIVEHGTLFKSRHALPRTFVEVDDEARVVRASVSKQIFESSPKLDDDALDERAVAEHYGLAEGHEAPPSEGYGETIPDDPAWGAERDRERAGMAATEQERARIR